MVMASAGGESESGQRTRHLCQPLWGLGRVPGVPPHLQHPATWGPPSAADALAGALATAGRSATHGCAAKVLARHVQGARAAGLIPDWAATDAAATGSISSCSQQTPQDQPVTAATQQTAGDAETEQLVMLAQQLVQPLMANHRLYTSQAVLDLLKTACREAKRPQPIRDPLFRDQRAQQAAGLEELTRSLSVFTFGRYLRTLKAMWTLEVPVLPSGASNERTAKFLSCVEHALTGHLHEERTKMAADSAAAGSGKGKAGKQQLLTERDKWKATMEAEARVPDLHGALIQDVRVLPRLVHLIAGLSVTIFPVWDSSKTLPAFALQVEQLPVDNCPTPATLIKICSCVASKGSLASANAPVILVRAGSSADDLARRVVDEVGGKHGACRLMAQGDEAELAKAMEVLRKARGVLSTAKKPKDLYAVPFVLGSSAASLARKGGRKGPGPGAAVAGGAGDNTGSSGGGGEGAAVSVAGSWDPRASHTICFFCVVLRPGQVDKAWLVPGWEASLEKQVRNALEDRAVIMAAGLGTGGKNVARMRMGLVLHEAKREALAEEKQWQELQDKFNSCVQKSLRALSEGTATEGMRDAGSSSSSSSSSSSADRAHQRPPIPRTLGTLEEGVEELPRNTDDEADDEYMRNMEGGMSDLGQPVEEDHMGRYIDDMVGGTDADDELDAAFLSALYGMAVDKHELQAQQLDDELSSFRGAQGRERPVVDAASGGQEGARPWGHGAAPAGSGQQQQQRRRWQQQQQPWAPQEQQAWGNSEENEEEVEEEEEEGIEYSDGGIFTPEFSDLLAGMTDEQFTQKLSEQSFLQEAADQVTACTKERQARPVTGCGQAPGLLQHSVSAMDAPQLASGQEQGRGQAVAGPSYCGATSTTIVHERLAPTFLAPRTSPGPQSLSGAGLRWGRWGAGWGVGSEAQDADFDDDEGPCGIQGRLRVEPGSEL